MSKEIVWEILKTSNCFEKKRGVHKFSTEKGNLMNLPSFKYSGLLSKTVDIQPADKGVVLTTTSGRRSFQNKPKKLRHSVSLKKHYRASANAICRQLKTFRPDLKAAALARYSQLYHASKVKKTKVAPTTTTATKA